MRTVIFLLTERCNASCLHCMQSATLVGKDMDFSVFCSSIDMIPEGWPVMLTGGEPTLHPSFRDFVDYAAAKARFVQVMTNGLLSNEILWLHESRHENLFVTVSQTEYHQKIDQSLLKKIRDDRRFSIHEKDHKILAIGRGAELPEAVDWERDGLCCCPASFIDVNGNLLACGCPDACSRPLTKKMDFFTIRGCRRAFA